MTDHSSKGNAYGASADIFVTFKVEGLHHWPDAPPRRNYLSNPHRHQFGFRVETTVKHDDREIEFHDLRDGAERMARELGLLSHCLTLIDFGAMSCEHIARELGAVLARQYERSFVVTVDEDGECGATVETVFV